jgi:hypothetical protein
VAPRPVNPRTVPPARTGNGAQDRAHRKSGEAVRALLDGPLARVVRVGTIDISTGQEKDIPHGLGKAPTDWFVTSPRTFGRVKEVSRNASYLRLTCDTGVQVTLWVVP